jgi:hypothetical protein
MCPLRRHDRRHRITTTCAPAGASPPPSKFLPHQQIANEENERDVTTTNKQTNEQTNEQQASFVNMMVIRKHLLVCAVALGMTGVSAYIVNRNPSSRNAPLLDRTQNAKQHQLDVSTSNSPATAFRGNPPIHQQFADKQIHQQQRQKLQNEPVSYSLGLGQNLPVRSRRENDLRAHDNVVYDVYKAVQYWVEQENVNEYPNPLLVARAREAAQIEQKGHKQLQASEKRGKSTAATPPKIVPKRFFGDSLPIFSEPEQQLHLVQSDDSTTISKSVPIMKSRKLVVDRFDLNTPWVEMLIHEQQMKFQAS